MNAACVFFLKFVRLVLEKSTREWGTSKNCLIFFVLMDPICYLLDRFLAWFLLGNSKPWMLFTLSCSISLMSFQCCNSSVNHCGFIHPSINLGRQGAAALATNLNVFWIAVPVLRISAPLTVPRWVITGGLLFLALPDRYFVLLPPVDRSTLLWSRMKGTVICSFTGVLDLG